MAILESIFGNPQSSPNALMRFGAALQGPQAQAVLLEQQKQAQLKDLISKMGAVPSSGMGPQQPIAPKDFLMQLAGITGDAGGLASYLVSEQKQQAEEARQKQIAAVLGGTPLQQYATAGNASGPNPLNVQNNNPGNLRDPQTGSFRLFDSPQDGMNAMAQDLTLKISGNSPSMLAKFGQGYKPTLRNVISTWAPPSENNTDAYIQNVSQNTGIDPDQPLTVADVAKIQAAMIKQEGGDPASKYFTPVSAAMPNVVKPPEALAQLAKLAQIDPEKYAASYLSAKATDEANQKKNEDSVITPDNAALTGDQFLETIDNQDVKNKAKAIIEGRAPFPTINSRTPTNIKKALEAAQQADPTLSATTFPMRAKAAKDFASGGQESKNVNALNTAINHLAELKKAAEGLNNGPYKVWNATENAVSSNFDDFNSRLQKYQAAKLAVASEVAKVYKGVGALSQEEQEHWQKLFSPSAGPASQNSAITETAKLLTGKIDALSKQYSDAFGGKEKDFLSEKAKKTLNDLGLGDPAEVSPGISPPNPNMKDVNWVIENGKLVQR